MEKKYNHLLSTRIKSIVLGLYSFIMFYVFSFFTNPYSSWWVNYLHRPLSEILAEWAFTLAFCFIIAIGSILIHKTLNRFIPWIEKPAPRLFLESALHIVLVLLLIYLQILVVATLTQKITDGQIDLDTRVEYWKWITICIFIALSIFAIHTGDYLINNWKNAALEATELRLKSAQHKQAAAESELEALKLQLDPHFVFNNLSVLSELILEDQQLGYNYSENFAKVYRYLLVNSKKDLINLEDEMKFLNAYVYLLKQRAGDGICFELDVDPNHLKLQLPPMTVQLLIENAMKHNKFLKSYPLKITIRSWDDAVLIVSNTIIPLQKKEASSGLGLKNIKQRYLLLSDRVPQITSDDLLFTVSIPLIKS